ncbi:MAG: peptide MFS transporter [Phycisphaeraceae bacterium]|nr:peptide MFS transporter [Phycisphaeraceae bacterium]
MPDPASSETPRTPAGPAAGPTRDADFEAPAIKTLGGGPLEPVRQGHPGGLYLLFVTEMWERFSFYGMRAFLMLFMTAAVVNGGLGWDEQKAASLYGWYTALVYLTPIIGGYMADKLLGTHYSMVLGGAIIAAGHFTLALETIPSFYVGLLLIVVGTGFFKPCVSVMVSQLYPAKDKRRDAAFTIFYMGINLGAFLGPIVCGGLRIGRKQGEVFGWSWAFAAAGVGMVLGLLAYMIGRPFLLKGIGLPEHKRSEAPGQTLSEDVVCATCGQPLAGRPAGSECPKCGTSTAAAPPRRRPLNREEKHGIAVIFIMAFFVIFFWTAFEQAGSSMNLFAENRTDRSLSSGTAHLLHDWATQDGAPAPTWLIALGGMVLLGAWMFCERSWRRTPRVPHPLLAAVPRIVGLAGGGTLLTLAILKATGFLKEAFIPDNFLQEAEYPAEWFQSVNPFCILVFAPIFAAAWLRLGRAGREPSTPVKFALGLILLGLGFLFMVFAGRASDAGASPVLVSGWYLTAAYSIHTLGELCLSPVGLSMVNKLAPVRFVSLLMGVWFLANFAANKIAGTLAGYNDAIAAKQLSLGGIDLTGQSLFYALFTVVPIVAGIVVLLLAPALSRLMHGRA